MQKANQFTPLDSRQQQEFLKAGGHKTQKHDTVTVIRKKDGAKMCIAGKDLDKYSAIYGELERVSEKTHEPIVISGGEDSPESQTPEQGSRTTGFKLK